MLGSPVTMPNSAAGGSCSPAMGGTWNGWEPQVNFSSPHTVKYNFPYVFCCNICITAT